MTVLLFYKVCSHDCTLLCVEKWSHLADGVSGLWSRNEWSFFPAVLQRIVILSVHFNSYWTLSWEALELVNVFHNFPFSRHVLNIFIPNDLSALILNFLQPATGWYSCVH